MSTYLTKTRALAAAVLLAIAVAFGLATAPQSQAYAEGGDSLVGAQDDTNYSLSPASNIEHGTIEFFVVTIETTIVNGRESKKEVLTPATTAQEGQTIRMLAKPASGYYTVNASAAQGSIGVSLKDAGAYNEFKMPAGDVIAQATFEQLDDGVYSIGITNSFGMFGDFAEDARVIVDGQDVYLILSNQNPTKAVWRYGQFAWGKVTDNAILGSFAIPTLAEGKKLSDESLRSNAKDSDAFAYVTFRLKLSKDELNSWVSEAQEKKYSVRYVPKYDATHDDDWYSAKSQPTFVFGNLRKTAETVTIPANYDNVMSAFNKVINIDKDAHTAAAWNTVTAVLDAVDTTKSIDEQNSVGAMADAINDAIASLPAEDLKAAQAAVQIANEKAAAADEAAKAADAAMVKAAESGTVEDAAAAVAAADKATKAAAEAATAATTAKEAADIALKSTEAITDPDAKAQAEQAAQAVVDAADSAVSKAETAKTAAAAVATKAAEAKTTAEKAAAAAAEEAKRAAEEAAAAAKAPKDNTMQVSVKAKTLKAKKLKKKKQTVSAITVTDAKGAVTFSKVKVNKKKLAKKFTVNKKTGKITVKKGVKKGTYKVTVKVSAAGEGQFQPAEKNVVVTIKVK